MGLADRSPARPRSAPSGECHKSSRRSPTPLKSAPLQTLGRDAHRLLGFDGGPWLRLLPRAHNVRARLLPPLKHISTPPAATGTSAALSLGNARRRVVHDRRLEVSYDRVSWAEVTGPMTASAFPRGRAKSATSDAVSETAAATRKAS